MRSRRVRASLSLSAVLFAMVACMADPPAGGAEETGGAKGRMTLIYYNIPG